jgi:hypothetical protein
MPKLVTIQPHLSVKELEQRYRQCSDLVESRHYQIIWLLCLCITTEKFWSLSKRRVAQSLYLQAFGDLLLSLGQLSFLGSTHDFLSNVTVPL